MKVKDVSIGYFLSIKDSRFSLDNRGLLAIQGVNNDPSADSNGSGKSSLADAIFWCLFDETARGVSGDGVISTFAGKDDQTRVSVRLEDSGDEWVIMRTRKPASLEVWHKTANISKGTMKETQELVNKIVGASKEVFAASIYAGQEKMPNLPAMTDVQIKQIVEEASGSEVLAEAYAQVRLDLAAANHKLQIVKTREAAASTLTTQRHAAVATAFANTAIFGTEQARRVAAAEVAVKTASDEVDRLARVLDGMRLTAVIDADIQKNQDTLNGTKGEWDKHKELSKAALEIEADLRTLKNSLPKFNSRLVSAQVELKNVEKSVGLPCKSCGRPHEAEHMAALEKLAKSQVEKEVSAQQVAKDEIVALEKRLLEAQQALADYSGTMTDVSVVTDTIAKLNVEKTQRMTTIGDCKLAIQDHNAKKDALKDAKAQKNPYIDQEAQCRALLKETEETWDKLKAEVVAEQATVDVVSDAIKVFGPAGVRAHILDTVTPFLNAKTSEYLDTLSDGTIQAIWTTLTTNAKGEAKEKFSIEVSTAAGDVGFAAISGGEKRKVRLACALALQDLVASRAYKPIELFIADEIDDALDEAGLERLMSILEQKAKTKGTVAVISHNSLSDWIDNVITVTKTAGVSEVSGAVA